MANPEISLANVHEYVGQEIGQTDWLDIDQMQVNVFGEVTRWPTCPRPSLSSRSEPRRQIRYSLA